MSPASPSPSPSPLRALAALISSSVDILEDVYAQHGLVYPSLDDAYPNADGTSSKLAQDVNVVKACATICAAANQLVYSVRDPKASALFAASSFHLTAALRTAVELHLAEILHEAGPEGLHVNTIAERTKSPINPLILDRTLRFLASNHYFAELRPSVYTNNRTSAVLDKGLSVDQLLESPETAFDKLESAAGALIGFVCDENFKASSFMHETITDPQTSRSSDADRCAFSRAVAAGGWSDLASPRLTNNTTSEDEIPNGHVNGHAHTNGTRALTNGSLLPDDLKNAKATKSNWVSLWDFMAQPSPANPGSIRMKRFGVSMEGFARVQPIEEVLEGFPWSSLPPSALVVDVGGGVGALTAILEKKYKGLRYLVQDREEVAEEGKRRWESANPTATSSGRVSFQPHDFFRPQPLFPSSLTPNQPASVFLLKHIIHDWADEHARNILKKVREGAWAGGKIGKHSTVRRRKRKVSQNMGGDADGEVEYEEVEVGAGAQNGNGETALQNEEQQQQDWPATKLVVLDMLAPYACRVSANELNDDAQEGVGNVDMDAEVTFSTAGSFQAPAPEPLLPNYGGAWSPTYNADLAMLTLVNGQERTLAHTRALFASAGWKLTRVHQSQVPGFHLAMLEAEAV